MGSKNKGGGQKPPLLPICLPTYQRSKEPVHNLHTLWPYYNQIPCRHGLVYICTHCKYTNGSVEACQVICSLHWVCLLLTMLRPKKWGSLIFTKSQTCWKSSCPVALTWKKQPIQHYRWLTPGWRNSSLYWPTYFWVPYQKKKQPIKPLHRTSTFSVLLPLLSENNSWRHSPAFIVKVAQISKIWI